MFCNKNLLLILSIFTLLSFMNCAPLTSASHQYQYGVSTAAQEVGSDGVLFSVLPLGQLSIDRELPFFADETFFAEPIKQVLWDHNLNGTDFCEQKPGDTPWRISIQCAEPGTLNLFFIVEYESGVDETFLASIDVLAEPSDEPIDEPVEPGEPTPLNGEMLYSTSCAGCHGAGASSTKKGRSAGQIQNAITNNVGGMGILSTLSEEEVKAIADYLETL